MTDHGPSDTTQVPSLPAPTMHHPLHPLHPLVPTLALALLAGAASSCRFDPTPNPEHCYYAAGNQTCAARFGADKAYCVSPEASLETSCEGSSLEYGCADQPPPDECYSPCGAASSAAEDSSCLETADSTDTGDTTESEGGSEGDLDPVCGDGVEEGDEECDDGNEVDEDACSNACLLASCGDGVVQAVLGETCDDGNTESGDTCTSSCVTPGTLIWSTLHDLGGCGSNQLAVASTGSTFYVSACPPGERRVLGFAEDGVLLWDKSTIGTDIAANPVEDGFAVGGTVGSAGQTRYYDAAGDFVWSENVPVFDSDIHGVAFDGAGVAISVGSAPNVGLLYRYDANGDPLLPALEWPEHGFQAAVANAEGRVWALSSSDVLFSFTPDNEYMWEENAFPGERLSALALDASTDKVYATGPVGGTQDSFSVYAFDSEGVISWSLVHDDAGVQEAGNGLAALPTGGVLVAGYTNHDGVSQEVDALLSWYADEGTHVLDVVLDGEDEVDLDTLSDVAVLTDDTAIAVGYHSTPDLDTRVWLIKFHI